MKPSKYINLYRKRFFAFNVELLILKTTWALFSYPQPFASNGRNILIDLRGWIRKTRIKLRGWIRKTRIKLKLIGDRLFLTLFLHCKFYQVKRSFAFSFTSQKFCSRFVYAILTKLFQIWLFRPMHSFKLS